MGRGKIDIDYINDSRNRKISFKKRRFGILKKIMELSALSGCDVDLQIWNKDDGSLMKYKSFGEGSSIPDI